MLSPNGKLDYSKVIERYPWIIKERQDCILSPDSDGLLCGLFMSHYLDWKIKGFYDGKVLLLEKGFNMKDCVFLDMEIFRKEVKSIGQHMVMFNRNKLPSNWDKFNNAISANNLRNFDFSHNFIEKYPFGTVHLLMAIVGQEASIQVRKDAICPLLYVDGTFKNLFNYPENCLSWLRFLGGDSKASSLYSVFFNDQYSISQFMIALKELFTEFSSINNGKRGGDKIKISDTKGKPLNFDLSKVEELLSVLGKKTGWSYKPKHWMWGTYKIKRFRKGTTKPGLARYNDLISKNPLSLAIISRNNIEYTLER